MNYRTKELRAIEKAIPPQVDLHLDVGDIRFLNDFIKDAAFYIEDLEAFVGEELMDFWQLREHALRIITNWMMQCFSASYAKAA